MQHYENIHIIYYRNKPADQNLFDQECKALHRIQLDTNSGMLTCESWQDLMVNLNNISVTDRNLIPLILIDLSVLHAKFSTINELVQMLMTLHRCLSYTEPMKLAIVIDDTCSTKTLKEIHESDVCGIVPCSRIYGYDKTILAIHEIMSGKTHWCKDVFTRVHNADIIADKFYAQNSIHLTDRQKQVLALVCNRGLTNKRIAQVLKITESTVKIHISAILKEYGVRNRTQLVLAASNSLKASTTTGA